ncbi:ubiquitin-conjugating enzyme/RWD-like protein, partial [Schizothecium vesticola]
MKANNGGSVARRVFLELRSIKAAKIPFLSARALGDSMDKVLASIEGPPDTPYEGGIFWLKVHFQTADISQPPVLRFITRVYHPNIDCLGNICADYQDCASWFSTKSCLASILTAVCGLLASPNVEDPLVPEIAETYVKDHERYCEIARTYTLNHAM